MDIEHQKFMALEGIHAWARAIVVQVERIQAAHKALLTPATPSDVRINAIRQFQTERHQFLIAANKLLEYVDWAKRLDFLDPSLFSELEKYRTDIKDMRDLNEHAIEYFLDGGRFKERWIKADESSIADASSTVDDRIGNRLSWNDVSTVVVQLLEILPTHHWPKTP